MELVDYTQLTTRARRYRDAGKTFRFGVYVAIETYVVVSVLLGLAAHWFGAGWVASLLGWNMAFAATATVAHYGSLSLTKPWILLARATEAAGVGLLAWLVAWCVGGTDWTPAWELAVCVFTVRYWQVGEAEISRLAASQRGTAQ